MDTVIGPAGIPAATRCLPLLVILVVFSSATAARSNSAGNSHKRPALSLVAVTLRVGMLRSDLGVEHSIAARLPLNYPAISFLTNRTGWVMATRGTAITILHTSDTGHSWQRLAHLSLGWSAAPRLQFVDRRHGWISTIGPALCGGLKTPPCHTILLRTTDGGRHWRSLYAPDIFSGDAVTFVDPLHGFLLRSQMRCQTLCPRPRRLYATADGGVIWHPLLAAPRFPSMSMSWVNQHDGWIGTGDFRTCTTAIYATSNGGANWSRQIDLHKQCGEMLVGMLDTHRGWALGGMDMRYCSMGGCGDYTLYQTADGGRHWTVELAARRGWWNVRNAYGGFPGPPHFVTDRYGWIPFGTGAGPGDGGIAITTDGGRTWRRTLRSYPLGDSSIEPLSAQDGWATGMSRLCPAPACNADLLHTADGGRTWMKLHPA